MAMESNVFYAALLHRPRAVAERYFLQRTAQEASVVMTLLDGAALGVHAVGRRDRPEKSRPAACSLS